MRTALTRYLALVRRVSARIYSFLLLVLLSVVYVLVFPPFALARRFRCQRPAGWHVRNDPDVSALDRLRAPF